MSQHYDGLTRYRNEAGEEMNFHQIAMQSAKEGKDVRETAEGYRVDGELFQEIKEEQ